MINKNILFIGCNIITYEILSYINDYYKNSQYKLYIYDESIMYKRDFHRLSWWIDDEKYKEDNNKSSDICKTIFKECIKVNKDDLNKLNDIDMVIFTTSYVLSANTFERLLTKYIENNKIVILGMNHSLYGYYDNRPCIKKDDIKCNIYSLNDYVKSSDIKDTNGLVEDYSSYIYSCNNKLDEDNIAERFSYMNMKSIFYPLSTIIAMWIVRDIIEGVVETSIMIDWSLLKNENIYLKRIENDDYKYIECGSFMNKLRDNKLLIDVGNNKESLDILFKQLHYIGYLKNSKNKLYVYGDKIDDKYENIKWLSVLDEGDNIKDIGQSISINTNYIKKSEWDNIHIKYKKRCIYIHYNEQIPFVEIVNSIPDETATYNESSYSILDRTYKKEDYKCNWMINMGIAYSILQWIIRNKKEDIDKNRFRKYMTIRIDNKMEYNISKKYKEYYNNSYNDEYKRVIYTIPDIINKWSRLDVYEIDNFTYRLDELLKHIQEEYGIIPYKITYNDDILYDKDEYMNKRRGINKLIKPWIYKRTSERYKVIAIFNVYMRDSNGNDMICAPIYYHIGR